MCVSPAHGGGDYRSADQQPLHQTPELRYDDVIRISAPYIFATIYKGLSPGEDLAPRGVHVRRALVLKPSIAYVSTGARDIFCGAVVGCRPWNCRGHGDVEFITVSRRGSGDMAARGTREARPEEQIPGSGSLRRSRVSFTAASRERNARARRYRGARPRIRSPLRARRSARLLFRTPEGAHTDPTSAPRSAPGTATMGSQSCLDLVCVLASVLYRRSLAWLGTRPGELRCLWKWASASSFLRSCCPAWASLATRSQKNVSGVSSWSTRPTRAAADAGRFHLRPRALCSRSGT